MKTKAFSLIELLVVIAIISILCALIFPTFHIAKTKAKIFNAQNDMASLIMAINSYENFYRTLPTTKISMSIAANYNGDITYIDNSEVISILMDLEVFGDGRDTVNKYHAKNPQQHKFLNARLINNNISHGVGNDGIFRDPFGMPYIITLDANFDDNTKDSFYSSPTISSNGVSGLIKKTENDLDFYECHANVMVWSFGPDKKINDKLPANKGENRDNILSWK
jgi:prepilin-type N-terminal cleavage/methylation domain-containing protein